MDISFGGVLLTSLPSCVHTMTQSRVAKKAKKKKSREKPCESFSHGRIEELGSKQILDRRS